ALYHSQGISLPRRKRHRFYLMAKTESYLDKKSGKLKRRSPTTKNDHYRQMIQVRVRNGVRFRYVLNDSWYAAAEDMQFVRHKLDRHLIMALKRNRTVALSASDKAQGRYQTVSTLDLPAGT